MAVSLSPDARTLLSRALSVLFLLLLAGLCVAWELWLSPTGKGTLAIKALPLLPALPGLLRMRMYTYRWVSLLVWLYATEGLVRIGSEQGMGRWLALAEVALSVALFAACTLHIRWRLKRGLAAASAA